MTQPKNIPKLRFPEFRGMPEWEEKKLGNISDTFSGGTPSVEEKEYYDGDIPFIRSAEISNDTTELFLSHKGIENSSAKIVKKGDILYALYGATSGTVSISKISGAINQAILAIVPKKKYNSFFIKYWLEYNKENITNKYLQGGQGNLSAIIVKSFLIPFPTLPEQQKIADCLTTLDDHISAENDKLTQFKTHKKGLMQKLFPSEGQECPDYRFPEFQNAPAWEEKRLGEIGQPSMCKRIFKEQTSLKKTKNYNIPFYKIGTLGGKADAYISRDLFMKYKEKYLFPKFGDILISASGTIGRLVTYDGLPAYFQDSNIVWLNHDKKKILNSFLFYCLSIIKWQTSDGGVIKRLYNSDFKNIITTYPRDLHEQQKIADCLSSLDDLITAQNKKIALLKAHKKGLMQQLFV